MNNASNVSNEQARVALITGAAKRIGRHLALALAKRGWDIVVHYHRSSTEAEQVVAEITALGQRAIAIKANLAIEPEVKNLLPQALKGMGRVDCVVNNASLFDPDTAFDFSQATLDRHMHTNLMAPIFLAQALFEATPQNGQAVVIHILDQKLFNLNPDYLSYTLSKAALQCATTTLAQALAPRVRVVGVAPGLSMRSGDQSESDFQAAHRVTPLGRSSTPEDIAQAVCFIVDAPSITGTTILVDGGQHLIPTQRDVMYLASAKTSV